MNEASLDSEIKKGTIQLGRGNIISSIDIERNPGSYPIYSSSAKGSGEFGHYAEYMFNEEMVTWSIDGGGRFFYRPKHKFSVTNVSDFMRVDNSVWDIRFAYYCLDLQHRNIAFDYQSKAHPSIIRHQYKLPCFPKASQEKIAAILSTVDKAIEQTEAIIAKQQRIKTGLMQDLLTGGIDEHGNIRSEKTHAFKDSPPGRIPAEWSVKHLHELASHVVDCPHTTPRFIPSGHLVARTLNIKEGQFIGEESYVSEREFKDRSARLAPIPGDVIFTREAPIGEAFLIPVDMQVCLGQRTMLIRFLSDRCDPRYFVNAVYSQDTKIRFDQMTGGTTNPHLNVQDIRSFTIKTPEIEEQRRIAVALATVQNSLIYSERQKHKFNQLKTALMQDLLTGKVRVTPLLGSEPRAVAALPYLPHCPPNEHHDRC
jgi:type I restriction enzyme S subunit